jgi:hypothetical protein
MEMIVGFSEPITTIQRSQKGQKAWRSAPPCNRSDKYRGVQPLPPPSPVSRGISTIPTRAGRYNLRRRE